MCSLFQFLNLNLKTIIINIRVIIKYLFFVSTKTHLKKRLCMKFLIVSHFATYEHRFGPASVCLFHILEKLSCNLQSQFSKSYLANIFFNMSMFSNIVKIANATSVFKNDDPALCNNYRPI